jgi:hypothetical protein
MKETALQASRWLGDLVEPGREQAGIDGSCPLERLDVDGDIDQGIESTDGADVACFGSLNAQILGLAVDALTSLVRCV